MNTNTTSSLNKFFNVSSALPDIAQPAGGPPLLAIAAAVALTIFTHLTRTESASCQDRTVLACAPSQNVHPVRQEQKLTPRQTKAAKIYFTLLASAASSIQR